ncbi:MAG: heavy metal translocating P-type ATPase [Christensenellales bacterium]
MTIEEACYMENYFLSCGYIENANVNRRTCGITILYDPLQYEPYDILSRFKASVTKYSFDADKAELISDAFKSKMIEATYSDRLTMLTVGYFVKKLLPFPIRLGLTLIDSIKFIKKGFSSLVAHKIDVSVLDALAIGISIARGNYATAASVMYMLKTGEVMEEWTHRKYVNDLAQVMSLNVENVWRKLGDTEENVPITSVREGDLIILRSSDIVPLDGVLDSGMLSVNQSSLTGESLPVHKSEGAFLYGGTVVEEGDGVLQVTSVAGQGRYDRIVKMIEDSEKLKSATEDRAFHLADRLVPYSLLGSALTYLLTRDTYKAMAFLMVDFSCALKLAMPLTVLSAMKEANKYGISTKGGKFLENVAEAETIVFDKTGTLTKAIPKLVDVITFDGMDEVELLRYAACLEEHYPHSVANAVVRAAIERDIFHDEMHSKVEYVVAHGISSEIDGQKVIIGSYHFVFEDEKTEIRKDEMDKFDNMPDEFTRLYFAMDGVLKGVLFIFDPLKEEAKSVVDALHRLGLNRICMMTGDNEKAARAIANELNLDSFRAELLPEDKATYIREEHNAGRKVIMVGDGINDTPALSEADVGIAVRDGAAIAKEISDITIASSDLRTLIILKRISDNMMRKINVNYRFIIGFNSALIVSGLLGILSPTASALLHNFSTVAGGIMSTRPLLTSDDLTALLSSDLTDNLEEDFRE